jgi:hypothetical protein
MFWLVEDESQLQLFEKIQYKEAFVEVIPSSNKEHPTTNDICAVYIRPLNTRKGFILPITHSEALSLNINDVTRVLSNIDIIYVRDKKEYLHYFIQKGLYDITLNHPTYIPEFTQTHNIFYNRYPWMTDINNIIPIVKHYEYCENLYDNLKDRINEPINNFYNNKATMVFNAVERSGIHIDRKEFESHFHDVNRESIYTQYNFKTLTTRPSNKFKGVNYAALNKENGCRKSFIPKNDVLVEIDIGAYHPTLLAKLINYDFGEEDVHQAFANMYGVDYKKAKELTFKQLYGGVFEKYKDLEFFKKVQVYTDEMWEKFQNEGFVECSISKHKFERDKLENMKPQKLLNYILQNLETSYNVCILWNIIKLLKNKKTKLILYTYDSFLFDFKSSEKELYKEIIDLFKSYKLQTKINYGKTYDFR